MVTYSKLNSVTDIGYHKFFTLRVGCLYTCMCATAHNNNPFPLKGECVAHHQPVTLSRNFDFSGPHHVQFVTIPSAFHSI